ncbi:MAG: hypothetical protein HKN68_12265, partial [Saprospiraceae bacterium]|nr:hypothetical protein [Saprospiraceae bacterium]
MRRLTLLNQSECNFSISAFLAKAYLFRNALGILFFMLVCLSLNGQVGDLIQNWDSNYGNSGGNSPPPTVGPLYSSTFIIDAMVDETPASMGNPNLFELIDTYTSTTTVLGNREICDGATEGPDWLIRIENIPLAKRISCADVSFEICRRGDFGNPAERVYLVDENDIIIQFIGSSGSDCSDTRSCITSTLPACSYNSLAQDGIVEIALHTPGNVVGSNSGSDVDEVCNRTNGSRDGDYNNDSVVDGNCVELTKFSIQVFIPDANFTMSESTICIGESVTLTPAVTMCGQNFSVDGSTVGLSGTSGVVTYTPTTPGSYMVCNDSGSTGCEDQTCQTLTVSDLPEALDFTLPICAVNGINLYNEVTSLLAIPPGQTLYVFYNPNGRVIRANAAFNFTGETNASFPIDQPSGACGSGNLPDIGAMAPFMTPAGPTDGYYGCTNDLVQDFDYLIVDDASGCFSQGTFTLDIIEIAPEITPTDVCFGEDVIFSTTSGGDNYLFYLDDNGNNVQDAGETTLQDGPMNTLSYTGGTAPIPTGTTNIGVILTITSGSVSCEGNGTAAITVSPEFTVSVAGAEVCAYQTTDLTADVSGGTPAYTYNWSIVNNAGSSVMLTNPTDPTVTVDGLTSDDAGATIELLLEVTDVNGCETSTMVNVTVTDCSTKFFAFDPCVCNDDASVDGDDGTFNETITVEDLAGNPLPAGQDWVVVMNTGGLGVMAGDAFLYNAVDGKYELNFDHVDGQGYEITFTGPNGTDLSDPNNESFTLTNTCFYPDPVVVGPTVFCNQTGPIQLEIQGVDPSGATFSFNQDPVSSLTAPPAWLTTTGLIDPTQLAAGMQTIYLHFDAADMTGDTPGCLKTVSFTFEVQDPADLDPTFTASQNPACVGQVVTLTPMETGGVFTGVGVSDNGMGTGGTFSSATPGIYQIDYTLNSSGGCTSVYSLNVEVIEPQSFTLTDAAVTCSISSSGIFDLNGLFTSLSSTAEGGDWTGSNVLTGSSTLQYIEAGCYTVTYTPPALPAGVDPACGTPAQTAYVYVSEQPQPSFSIQNEICISDGDGAQVFTPFVNSPSYTTAASQSWGMVHTLSGAIPIINGGTGELTITPTGGDISGTITITLTETITNPICNGVGPQVCSEFYSLIINVQDGTAIDASFTANLNPVCINQTVNLIPETMGGLFTGDGVVDDGDGDGAMFSAATPGIYNVTHTINSTNGCTNVYSLNIEVLEPQSFTLTDVHIECSINPSGVYNLNGLITTINEPAEGGAWSGTDVVGNSLEYSGPGCYQVTYTPPSLPAGVDVSCMASAQSAFVYVSEQPQPNFSIQSAICLSAGDAPQVYNPVVNSPSYTTAAGESWSIANNTLSGATAVIDMNSGQLTLTPTGGDVNGSFDIVLTETITNPICNGTGPQLCSESYSITVNVEDGTALDASFTTSTLTACEGQVVTFMAATSGGVFTGLNVTDNGDGSTGSFTSATVGTYQVDYILNSPNGCTNVYSLNIEVIEPQVFTLTDASVECGINPSGIFNLNGLLTNASTSATGGTWSGTNVLVGTSTLQYNSAGCYEVTYTPPTLPAGADPGCEAAAATAYVYVSEQPQPSFSIQNEICISDGDGGVMFTPTITSPTYTTAATAAWSIVDNVTNATASIDAGTGIVTVNPTSGEISGSYTVTLTETITNPPCNGVGPQDCEQSYSVVVVVMDGTALDAGFTIIQSPLCTGQSTGLTPDVNGGVFTGTGVTDNGSGNGGTFSSATPGIYTITYTLNSPNGCSN